MEPVSNYLVATGGNPRYLSAICHLGNLIPNSKDRSAYHADGRPNENEVTRVVERNIKGAPRPFFPIREDFRGLIEEVYDDLQVNSKSEVPWKMVRYPVADGDKKAKMMEARIKWMVTRMKSPRPIAQHLAEREFYYFFNPEELDHQDPLGSLTEVNCLSYNI